MHNRSWLPPLPCPEHHDRPLWKPNCQWEIHFIWRGTPIDCNNGPNSLHGGPTGFHARVWDAVQPNESTVIFNYTSADGEEGFPGTLEVEMTYRLEDEANALVIEYRATTDKATVVNLTNHGFFNLAGISNPSPTVLNNILTINADFYVPIDEVSIPTGEILKVENTPMDFRTPHAIGERIDDKFQQLVNGAGYDHCYVLNKAESGELSLAATCTEPVSGRTMEVYTTENGLQLYTGNWLGGFTGAHGATFPARSAVCFEAQCFPDTPIFCNILPAGYPITAYAMKLANTPRVPIQLGTPN